MVNPLSVAEGLLLKAFLTNTWTSKYNGCMNRDNTIYLIGRIREKANAFILNELKNRGVEDIVPSHGDILVTLFKHYECTMTELANRIHRDRSTITTLVSKLTKLGYIETKKDPKDNRSVIVYLSDKGKELESTFEVIAQKLYATEYKGIGEEERKLFNEVLHKVLRNLNE